MKKQITAFTLLLLAFCAAKGEVTNDDLWFFADFDSVARLDGAAFLTPLPVKNDVPGRYGRAFSFTGTDKRAENKYWVISDPEKLKNFPNEKGAFACWFRTPEEKLGYKHSSAFGLCGFWRFQWVWRGDSFSAGEGRQDTAKINDFKRSDKWRHFAAVWNEEKLVLYIDGKQVAQKDKPSRPDMKSVPTAALRIGSGCNGSPVANLEMDEIAVIRRDITPEEVASLANAKSGILSKGAGVLATPVEYPYFWRNQQDAAVRMRLYSKEDRKGRVEYEIAGEKFVIENYALKAPMTKLVASFDPSKLKAGAYPWHLRFVSGDKTLLERSGVLNIMPRLERDEYKFLNWGGYGTMTPDYLKSTGINSSNVDLSQATTIRRYIANGIFPNIRYENNRRYGWHRRDIDPEAIRAAAESDFSALEGLHLWTTTLVNSEIYSSRYPQSATNHPKYHAWAEKELGFKPDFKHGNAPIAVNSKIAQAAIKKGIVKRGEFPQLDTLVWLMSKGLSPYLFGKCTTDALHSLDRDNIVWSEPTFEGVVANFDMLADWHYGYSTVMTLRELRNCAAFVRPYNKPYMATLGAGYWHGFQIPQRVVVDPKTKKRSSKTAAQSCDEVVIKTWMLFSAIPVHAMSIFSLDTWCNGEKEGWAEPGTSKRYGETWREKLLPAAMLLQDVPNVRAPVAILLPRESVYTADIHWGSTHYPNMIGDAVSEFSVPVDMIALEREIASGVLKNYRYVIMPMAKVLYDTTLKQVEDAARSGVKIVTDTMACKKFEGGVHIDTYKWYYHPKTWGNIKNKFREWYATIVPSLEKDLKARSEGDGSDTFTFVKEYDSVGYVTVVNNKRSDVPGFLNNIVTNSWYKPYGAAQSVSTVFNYPAGSAIYEFNSSDEDGLSRRIKTDCGVYKADYAPAEGRLFCIYPRELKSLDVEVRNGAIEVTLVDSSGAPAPGRQLIRLEVRDPAGVVHDETGLYKMEKGRLSIPLRLARDDMKGSFFKRWKISVRELTSGFTAKCSYRQ